MRLVLSRLALAELDEILAYIAERSPLGARNVEVRFRHAFDLIARHPEGAERVEQQPGVRRVSLGSTHPTLATEGLLSRRNYGTRP